jgi:hypothetical protein
MPRARAWLKALKFEERTHEQLAADRSGNVGDLACQDDRSPTHSYEARREAAMAAFAARHATRLAPAGFDRE